MPSRSSFQDGYSFFEKNIGVVDGAHGASRYVSGVEEEIDSFAKVLNDFGAKRRNSGSKQLQGDVAEFWHAHTFNIEAKAAESAHHAETLRSNRLASVDIKTNFGEEYSLKYRGDGVQSGKDQLSKTVYERFKESGMDSLEDFLNKKKLEGKDPNLSLYQGQGRIVPSDQLSAATEHLKKRYNKEAYNRPEQAAKYQETLERLDDRIRDGEGIESHPLSRPDSERLTVEAQKGNVDAELLKQFGVSLEKIVKCEDVLKQAMKAGKTAAVIEDRSGSVESCFLFNKNRKVEFRAVQKNGAGCIRRRFAWIYKRLRGGGNYDGLQGGLFWCGDEKFNAERYCVIDRSDDGNDWRCFSRSVWPKG